MIELPFPEKALWPNGRAHWGAKSRAFKKHKEWAHMAALAELPRCFKWNGEPVRLRYTITPKTAHKIDADNCVAAMKAYQDGIAAALGVDDSAFAVPEIAFAPPAKPGRVDVSFVYPQETDTPLRGPRFGAPVDGLPPEGTEAA